ncbi:putative molybdenum-pterin-binding protein [Moraxella macacae 0408225]|uniref:Putative molybdenum-pterin-binding protein n=1 Tax=Moraxella macacae 0408225 TaxID=1230338 RepID=L2F977_9GAMM|nr:TOBE domain-containing protein [Moraxella macacae]ELA09033.1 putative molybdenum-pterin-binding protein [Moraxella macacae 0408225]
MSISARNQLAAKISAINTGAVNDVISVITAQGDTLTTVITSDSTKRLNLSVGSDVIAIFKAPSVIITTDNDLIYSSRNQLQGKITNITDGAVNAEISIETDNATPITAIITSQSVKNLNLSIGSDVTALIKASHIVLAVKQS